MKVALTALYFDVSSTLETFGTTSELSDKENFSFKYGALGGGPPELLIDRAPERPSVLTGGVRKAIEAELTARTFCLSTSRDILSPLTVQLFWCFNLEKKAGRVVLS